MVDIENVDVQESIGDSAVCVSIDDGGGGISGDGVAANDNESVELLECCNLMELERKNLPEDIIPNLKVLYAKYKDALESLSRSSEERESLSNDVQNYVKRCRTLEDAVKITNENCKQKLSEMEKKTAEYENALKSSKEKVASMEAHHSRYLEEMNTKTNQLLTQLKKKLEVAEKEKNDTVVRYAVREAEIMRLRDENGKHEKEKKNLLSEMFALKNSIEAKQLEKLEKELDENRSELIAERKIQREKDAEYQMAIKRIEAGQTAINELKMTLDQMQKQLARESEGKTILNEDYKKLVHQLQVMEEAKNGEIETARKELIEKEQLYEGTVDELNLVREERNKFENDLDELTVQYKEIVKKSESEKQAFVQLEKAHEEVLEKLRSLEDIHTQVSSSLQRAEDAEKAAELAKSNMDQAELEASECRRQAERMLEVTRQLTERNSALSSECEALKEELKCAQEILRKKESELTESKTNLESTEEKLDKCQHSTGIEIAALKSSLDKKDSEFKEVLLKLEEANNEKEVIKKKNASFIKELRAELHVLRRKQSSCPSVAEQEESESICLPINGHLGGSTSSRASSVSSVDFNSRTANGSPPPPPTTATPEQTANILQQQMVEKIVKLQKTLAKKQEKIEFLEEHVQQCTRELCKKTKIIQNYALREEAALLLPVEDALSKVPLSRRTGGVSLMGSMFSAGDKKTELELATEVNSRLQAVLEDTLYKNITLKTNMDTLGEEIARLSRENRQLSLQKSHDS